MSRFNGQKKTVRISAGAEIALESGFTDSNYFSRKFREVTGCSPREFRVGCRQGGIKLDEEISRILQPGKIIR